MNYLLSFLLYFSVVVAGAQTMTFDLYGHTEYFNSEPKNMVIFNENWQNKIEYGESFGGYHKKVELNFNLDFVETTEYDNNGNKMDYKLEVMDIMYEDLYDVVPTFLVYNPQQKLFLLYYINENGSPQLLIEDKYGVGYFHRETDFRVRMN